MSNTYIYLKGKLVGPVEMEEPDEENFEKYPLPIEFDPREELKELNLRHLKFEEDYKRYEAYLASLPSIEVHESLKSKLVENRRYELGKDFEIDPIIRVGSKMKCLFNNSGNKFWFNRNQQLTVTEVYPQREGVPDKLRFDVHPNSTFYANDFEFIDGEMTTIALPLTPQPERLFTLNEMRDAFESGQLYQQRMDGARGKKWPDMKTYFSETYNIDIQ